MPSPVFAEVNAPGPRGNPPLSPDKTPALRNVRPIESVYAQQAPDPVRQGDTPCRPARQPIVTFLAIAPYRAVMRDFMWVNLTSPDRIAATPGGRQLPFVERSNVARGEPVAYGSLHLKQPTVNSAVDPKLDVRGPYVPPRGF